MAGGLNRRFGVAGRAHVEEGLGGLPVCFPWFGNRVDNPGAPAHGFVRTRAWQLESIVEEGGAIHRATFGSTLTLELIVTNTGTTPMRFEEALHSYHRIGSAREVQVRGLDAVTYRDKADSNREKTQHGDIAIVSETDRTFLNTGGPIDIIDPVLRRRVRIARRIRAQRLYGTRGPRERARCRTWPTTSGCNSSASRPATSTRLPWISRLENNTR
jgi:glucose-6-phosphate 1-epimerase